MRAFLRSEHSPTSVEPCESIKRVMHAFSAQIRTPRRVLSHVRHSRGLEARVSAQIRTPRRVLSYLRHSGWKHALSAQMRTPRRVGAIFRQEGSGGE
jgi:hypothetical protein